MFFNVKIRNFYISFFLVLSYGLFAQQPRDTVPHFSKDSLRRAVEKQQITVLNDSLPVDSLAVSDTSETRMHSPKLAAILSASIPGAGQVYNKKYWKVPIVYAGFAGLIYVSSIYAEEYHKYRSVYEIAVDDTTGITSFTVDGISGYTQSDLKTRRNFYRKYRDLSYICIGAWYVLNIIDANVDAQFFNFSVDDDLTLEIGQPTYYTSVGLSVRLRF